MSTRNVLHTRKINSSIGNNETPLIVAYNLPKDELISLINECDFIILSGNIDKYKEIIKRKINICLKSNPEIIMHKDLIEKFCKIDKGYEIFKKQEVKIQTRIDEKKLLLLRKILLEGASNFPGLKGKETIEKQMKLYVEESGYKGRIESSDHFLELFEKGSFEKKEKEKVEIFENPKKKEEIQDLTIEIDKLFNILILFGEKTDVNDLLNDNLEKKKIKNRENIKLSFNELKEKFSQLRLSLYGNESIYEIGEDIQEKYRYIDALIKNLSQMIEGNSELILDIYEKNILELKQKIEPFKYIYDKINKAKKGEENDII